MSALIEEYQQISQSFIDFIAVFKVDIEKNAAKVNANKFYTDRDFKKLEDLYIIKKRFDFLMQSMLLIDSDTFESGRTFGYKEAHKEFDHIMNPYSPFLPSQKESYREEHKLQVDNLWPEHRRDPNY